MRRAAALPLSALLLVVATAAAADAPRLGPDSQLPVPRFESLAAAKVHGRRGPGLDHRIDWTYEAAGLPVQVLEESASWRRVRDPAGDRAWVRADMLSPDRTVYVSTAQTPGLPLRSAPRPEARVDAYLAKGVVAKLESCVGGWRKVAARGQTGWVDRQGLWGADDCAGVAAD
jgi:SH3-like domain-containing protein